MERINDLLSRLPIPGLKASHERHVIAEILTEHLSIPISAKKIQFTDNILTVSVPPIVKSALKIHQTALISLLATKGISVNTIR